MANDVSVQHPTEQVTAAIQEKVLLGGDLRDLSTEQRLAYYKSVCESLGLNPLTKPFEYLDLQGKLILYARKDACDQLRNRNLIDVTIVDRQLLDEVIVVTARATDLATQRHDESIGAVPRVKEDGEWQQAQSGKRYFRGNGTYKRLAPDELANALMKAETKAKRRVTLSICGLGMLDETEIEDIPQEPIAIRSDVANKRDVVKKIAEMYRDGLGEGGGPASPPVVDQQATDAQAVRPVTPEELNDTVQAIHAAISQQEVTALLSEAAGARQADKMTAVDFGAIQKVAQQRLKQLGKK